MRARVVVNRHVIKSNLVHGRNEAVFSIQTSRGVIKADSILIKDARGSAIGRLVYRPEKPLKCGATVWLETDTLRLEAVNGDKASDRS